LYVFGQRVKIKKQGGILDGVSAVMNIYSDSGYPLIEADNKYVQNKNYLYNDGNVEYYYIEGSNHYTLTDLVRKSPILCTLLGGNYSKPGYNTLEFINQKSLDFFDRFLSKQKAPGTVPTAFSYALYDNHLI
jgi:hypothetical protein